MKKVKLLQITVYIAFGLFFLQDSAVGFMEGFKEGWNSVYDDSKTHIVATTVIPAAELDGRLLENYKNGVFPLNGNYSLERVSIIANVRVRDTSVLAPWWLGAINCIMVFGILILLGSTAYMINKIIYHIYTGNIFEKTPVELIRKTGFLLIIYFVADYIYQQVNYFNDSALLNPPVTILNNSSFNFEALICGLLVLIVAEAFKQGAQLKEEQELTI